MKNYPVQLKMRIDWSELDLFGHVNNVAYFKYIQASRVYYWERTGLYASFQNSKMGPILLSTSCQFKEPLFYPGDILVESGISFIKNTSFGLHHRILNEQHHVVAEAEDIIVNFDFGSNKKIPVSHEFRTAAEAIEGRKI